MKPESMRRTLGLASVFAVAAAQTIDPNSVDVGTRTAWCNSQMAQCPLICAQVQKGIQATNQNDCDPTTLNFHCLCDNNITPNTSEYSLTIPYYECTTAADQCVANCGAADNACKGNCRTAHPCGAQNPTRITLSSTTSSISRTPAAATGSASGGGLINGAGTGSGGSSGVGSRMDELGRFWGFFVAMAATATGALTFL